MLFPIFNKRHLTLKPLSERKNNLSLSSINQLGNVNVSDINEGIKQTAEHIIYTQKKGASTILMMGAHVIRSGVQNYLIDLMEREYISCLAMSGAGIIHDFEFAMMGATTESVAHYIKNGQFGLWKETGILNDIINHAYKKDEKTGMGYAVGRAIAEGDFHHKKISLLAAGYRLNIPVTVHVGIGYDIIHEHPNCDGAATGALSYNDFLRFAFVIENLENGVVMNFGSSVMAPEVFLKALSMARNITHQKGTVIKHFTTLVCDLYNLPRNYRKEPPKDSPAYYFRPCKTMLVRTVAEGGESYYVKGNHEYTIPALWVAINEAEKRLKG
ncbi:MAG: hypothetical protein CMH78_05105 [Nitrospinae bacterium]|jgi:hypothetical protein|nr:hypothetical protein [Nitrospinota bacterium]|tara:strand:- start:1462 stop:2445 length:984 start_codon:yes stop_codon:yes gene_type:complete